MLELRGVTAGYGHATVLAPCTLTVGAGEIVALVGANGAGKSTLVKTISGLLPARSGTVTLDGVAMAGWTPGERVRRGVAHVPEGRQVFGGLSVEENLLLGAHARPDRGGRAALTRQMAEVCRFFPVLLERMGDTAANLSGGQQQMLAIARGLMGRPRFLLLDEPSLGLSPALVADIFRLVVELRAAGLSILLAEQNARQSLAIADRAYVLETGRVTAEGSAAAIMADADVAAKYLGVGAAAASDDARQAALQARLTTVLSW